MGRDIVPLQTTTWGFGKSGGSTNYGKKEKENVLIDLELMNLKSDFLLNYGEFRTSVAEEKKMKLVEANNEYQRNFQ
jgi:hypothetical protein